VPHTVHLREFRMPDGRPLLLDRRGIGFICAVEGSPDKTIIGLKVFGQSRARSWLATTT
jgi:hypothetical protein